VSFVIRSHCELAPHPVAALAASGLLQSFFGQRMGPLCPCASAVCCIVVVVVAAVVVSVSVVVVVVAVAVSVVVAVAVVAVAGAAATVFSAHPPVHTSSP